MSVRLVVHADDLGVDPSITAGAIEAWRDGLVTSASVMPSATYWEDASEQLRRAEGLDLGVHLSLCEGRPVRPAGDVASLVRPDGRFYGSLRALLPRVGLGRIRPDQVELEWAAQIERVLAAGHRPTHLDGHKHLHLLPQLVEVLVRLARRYSIGVVRLSREPGPGPRRAMRETLRVLSDRLQPRLAAAGIESADRSLGLACAGACDSAQLSGLLARLGPGCTELIVHPGRHDPARAARMRADGLAWEARYAFAEELRALTQPGLAERLREAGVELHSWADFERSPPGASGEGSRRAY